MNSFSKIFREGKKQLIIKSAIAILIFLGGILYTDLILPISQIAIPIIPKSVLLVVILFLVLCLSIVVSYLVSIKNKFKNPYKDYLIGSKGGLIKHKDSGLLFCPICFAKGRLSPLYDTMGFICHICDKRLPRVRDDIYLPYPLFINTNDTRQEE